MQTSTHSTRLPLAQVIDRIYQSGRITRIDENYFLQATIADELLSHEEQVQVRNVFDRLQMGLLQVVD